MACGTGGMLSTTHDFIKRMNPDATIRLFGQENNPESYAICLADMLIKGQKADNIRFADTMKEDCFEKTSMRFVIANPPFGLSWGGKDAGDGVEKAVRAEAKKGTNGRFGAGLPATGDMQLLFMQHAIAKMSRKNGRAAIISNGSPLFSGNTTSGESQIRRFMLEKDLIEAIIALPSQLFYNTDIGIYAFILSKNKRKERVNKIQLINAVDMWEPLKRSLGKKRREISKDQIDLITEVYAAFASGSKTLYSEKRKADCKIECRIFDREEFTYREKDEKETAAAETEAAVQEELVQQFKGYRNPFSSMLIESKNLIFRGAPGTGKSYLAKEIATDIISNGYFDDYTLLTDEQKKQVEFVQFHPSYDYSDFVEGLRPRVNDDGTMGFELQDGIFKKFVARARKNYEDSQKSRETIEKEISVQESMTEFFSGIELGVDTFKTINGNEFTVTSVDDKHINISIPGNATVNKLTLSLDEVRKMLESGQKFDKIKDITTFFGKSFATQAYSYDFALYKAIRAKKNAASKTKAKQEELKKYIFIIDEINRGEISKIFGELFFAIDPGYRGKSGEISTQYANLHSDPDEKFYIPENVYIIGTMNDIDRSVDSFDFAMRRRFRFVELRADERLEMLALLENEELETEAIRRMSALNREIANVEDLNENYQIGASYFLKLKTLDFDQLWTDYLQPLLQEYVQGMYDEEGLMKKFAKAYGYQEPVRGDVDETTQDQG